MSEALIEGLTLPVNILAFSLMSLVGTSYYVKGVRIRSCSGPHFPASRLNTERYSVSLRIQFECGIVLQLLVD